MAFAPTERRGPAPPRGPSRVQRPRVPDRRAAIASACASYEPGGPIPDVHYTEEEDEVWRIVSTELAAKHERFACSRLPRRRRSSRPARRARPAAVRGGRASPRSHRVQAETGIRAWCRRGSSTARSLTASSTRRSTSGTTRFPSTHPSRTSFTRSSGTRTCSPGPSSPTSTKLAGQASLRATSDEAHEFFSKVFWFTLEFGVVFESGELRAYGAGLLSSYGEIEDFREAETRPFDIAAMGTLDYDITRYQPVLFAASSFAQVLDELTGFFSSYDDEMYAGSFLGYQSFDSRQVRFSCSTSSSVRRIRDAAGGGGDPERAERVDHDRRLVGPRRGDRGLVAPGLGPVHEAGRVEGHRPSPIPSLSGS